MSVVLETSLGDLIIDLHHKAAPLAAKNFLKLCKRKFYNGTLFFNVQKDFLAAIKTQQPATTIYGSNYFEDQTSNGLKHNKIGVVSTSNSGPHKNNSDFFITLSDHGEHNLNHRHTIFGQVMEGLDVLEKLNQTHTDDGGRPLLNIRIHHTYILDDPFEDGDIKYPSRSPSPHYIGEGRIEMEEQHLIHPEDEESLIKKAKEHQAKKRAVVLEMLEDIPDADVKPPENVLYVCKLNPVTEEKDLEVIFSKFGGIKSCEVVRDWKTGMSLQYAFIEFETVASCEEAYMKMENALIDERRIHVDFCQSAVQQWRFLRRAQLKKKELTLLRDQKISRNKDRNIIDQLQLKKDYYNNTDKYSYVVDKKELHQQAQQYQKDQEMIAKQQALDLLNKKVVVEPIKKVIEKSQKKKKRGGRSSSSRSSVSSSGSYKRRHKKKNYRRK